MSTALHHTDRSAATGEVRRLTGPQSAAIAVFRLSGRPALEVAAQHLRLARPRPLWELPLDAIAFGHWLHPAADPANGRPEDVVLCRVAPEVVELHTHGGPAVARSLCETFRQQGVAVVDAPGLSLSEEPGSTGSPPQQAKSADSQATEDRSALLALLEPTWWDAAEPSRLVEHRWPRLLSDLAQADLPTCSTATADGTAAEPDLQATLLWLQSQAAAALAHCQGGTAGQWLWDQLRGALLLELQQIAQLAAADRTAAAARLDEVLATWSWGQYLERPVRVLITGPPNVGKSSLINALLGYQRAVVSPIPGTTRDLVQQATVIAGWEFRLTDSAGLRTTDDLLEARGIQKIAQAAAAADLILAVQAAQPDDLSDGSSDGSSAVGGAAHPPTAAPLEHSLPTTAPTLVLLNKIDLCPSAEEARPLLDQPATIDRIGPVSARTLQGLDAVVAAMVSAVLPTAALRIPAEHESRVGRPFRPPAAVVFCRSVYVWLNEWRQRLGPDPPGERT